MTFFDDLSDYDRILQVSKFCGKIITCHDFFCTENPYSKLFLGRTFLIVNRFSIFSQHILGQTKRQILQRKYFAYS